VEERKRMEKDGRIGKAGQNKSDLFGPATLHMHSIAQPSIKNCVAVLIDPNVACFHDPWHRGSSSELTVNTS
jgi:hypothetical protein